MVGVRLVNMRLALIALSAVVILCACTDLGSGTPPNGSSTSIEATTTLPQGPTTGTGPDVFHPVDPAFPVEFLSGSPLEEPSGLSVVARDFVFDVDADAAVRIGGLPETQGAEFWSVQSGPNAIINCYIGCSSPDVFILAKGESVAQAIGSGSPVPGLDGIWLEKSGRCTITKVNWNGAVAQPETEFDCGLHFVEETALGLVAWTETYGSNQGALVDPITLVPVLEVGAIHGVVGPSILYRQDDHFVLHNTETKTEIDIAIPTNIGEPDYGRPSPDGSLLALAFKHPAWPGPRQRLDIWLLDTNTFEWTRLPSMPVAAALKGSAYAWTDDGRLVLYGNFDEAGVAVATYKPGDAHLRVAKVDQPPAASIVAWCTSPACNS